MREKLRFMGLGLVVALATSGCAQTGHFTVAFDPKSQLEARGPGTVFPSVEAAAVDALIYTYLQANNANDTRRMRGGTIYSVGTGYSYGEIHLANDLLDHLVNYSLKQRDVARFHRYPFSRHWIINPRNERISQADRRSVDVTDPLHRPLFILHPSLVISEYRGRNYEIVEVANLRHPTPEILFASRPGADYHIYCASCHGETGAGDGPVAQALNPKPARHNDGAYMKPLEDDYLFKVIKFGGASVGKSAMMAPLGLSDQQIHNVIAFMRTLADPPYQSRS